MMKISSSLLFYRQRDQGPEKLGNLLRSTEPGSSSAGLHQAFQLEAVLLAPIISCQILEQKPDGKKGKDSYVECSW